MNTTIKLYHCNNNSSFDDSKLYDCYLNVYHYDVKSAIEFYSDYKKNGFESYGDVFELKAREAIAKLEVLGELCTNNKLGNKINDKICELDEMLDNYINE